MNFFEKLVGGGGGEITDFLEINLQHFRNAKGDFVTCLKR